MLFRLPHEVNKFSLVYTTNIFGTTTLQFGTRAYIFSPPIARSHDKTFFIWGTTIFLGAHC